MAGRRCSTRPVWMSLAIHSDTMRCQKTRWALLHASALLIAALVVLPSAGAATTITIVNLDDSGEGFNDASAPDPDSIAGGNTEATLGEQRLFAF